MRAGSCEAVVYLQAGENKRKRGIIPKVIPIKLFLDLVSSHAMNTVTRIYVFVEGENACKHT